MKFRFQSFVDVSTSTESMQVLQWSVGGAEVVDRCRHLFGAYKYFKLGKISVKMVPASTLPVDPQGLSYADDDPQTVDPRDQMNPGLVRITNGEDIFTNVSELSDDEQVAVYNAMMLDPRWSKFMLQSGFRRSAYPLYWQIGQLSQDRYPGSVINTPYLPDLAGQPSPIADGVLSQHLLKTVAGDSYNVRTNAGSSARGLFQVGHRGRIGFLPTDGYQDIPNRTADRFTGTSFVNNVPEVRVVTCVLPKAYKTVYYYRVFITEEVIFSGIRSVPPTMGSVGTTRHFGIDQFLTAQPTTISPKTSVATYITNAKMNNGDQQI